jgi:hypothetical protein
MENKSKHDSFFAISFAREYVEKLHNRANDVWTASTDLARVSISKINKINLLDVARLDVSYI